MQHKFKWPRAGLVLVKYFNSTLFCRDHYFFAVEWRDDSHVLLAWCNRQQTEYVVEVCSVPEGLCQRVPYLFTQYNECCLEGLHLLESAHSMNLNFRRVLHLLNFNLWCIITFFQNRDEAVENGWIRGVRSFFI